MSAKPELQTSLFTQQVVFSRERYENVKNGLSKILTVLSPFYEPITTKDVCIMLNQSPAQAKMLISVFRMFHLVTIHPSGEAFVAYKPTTQQNEGSKA